MGNVRPVLVVTGTAREAAAVKGLGIVTLAGGGDATWLAGELARLAPKSAGIISFGMAGALDPSLKLGEWVIGTSVCEHGRCDDDWVVALAQALPDARLGLIHADGALVATATDKQRIADETGARAADMESHLAAQAAAQAGVPFAVLRCISDTASTDLPPAIAVAMRPGGGLAIGAVLASLIRQPGQIPALIATVRGFARAYRVMREEVSRIEGRLGFDLR